MGNRNMRRSVNNFRILHNLNAIEPVIRKAIVNINNALFLAKGQ